MELMTPGSVVRQASEARHVTDCDARPCKIENSECINRMKGFNFFQAKSCLLITSANSLDPDQAQQYVGPGLEKSTSPLVFTSASGCRASENFDISSEN